MKKNKILIVLGVIILFVMIGAIFGKREQGESTSSSMVSDISSKASSVTSSASSTSATSNPSSVDDKLSDFGILSNTVRNDSTGNYRLMRIADNVQIEDIALDYYKKYFEDSKEIHFIVNFSNNTTTSITDMGTFLDVTVHEYIKKEEHDAKVLGGGEVLAQYHVDKETGKVEKVQ